MLARREYMHRARETAPAVNGRKLESLRVVRTARMLGLGEVQDSSINAITCLHIYIYINMRYLALRRSEPLMLEGWPGGQIKLTRKPTR